jgi:hypothetical protein
MHSHQIKMSCYLVELPLIMSSKIARDGHFLYSGCASRMMYGECSWICEMFIGSCVQYRQTSQVRIVYEARQTESHIHHCSKFLKLPLFKLKYHRHSRSPLLDVSWVKKVHLMLKSVAKLASLYHEGRLEQPFVSTSFSTLKYSDFFKKGHLKLLFINVVI